MICCGVRESEENDPHCFSNWVVFFSQINVGEGCVEIIGENDDTGRRTYGSDTFQTCWVGWGREGSSLPPLCGPFCSDKLGGGGKKNISLKAMWVAEGRRAEELGAWYS